MKKTIFLFGIFSNILFFAQEKNNQDAVQNTIYNSPDYKILQKKMNMKDVVLFADTKPEFPGGFDVFSRRFFENMPTIDMKQNQKLDTRIYFIVEKNGYVRNVAATGSDKKHIEAAELGVRRIFIRWKPATKDGKPVRYLYTFPLSAKKYN